jgi:hypothetical protein
MPVGPRHAAEEHLAAAGDRIQINARDRRLTGDAPLFP